MTLYDIDQQLIAIMEAVDPETGEWVGDQKALDDLNMARDQKIENIACFIKDLRGDIAKLKSEIEGLQKRMKVLQSKEAWLLENLRRSLDGQKFESSRCVVQFKLNPEKVEFTDEKAVLAWAVNYRQDAVKYSNPTLSKDVIKSILKDGTEVPGAELVRDTRMEVK